MLILRSLFTVTQKNSPADTENRICRRVFLCIRFPYSGISLCTFLYFLKYTGICFYSAFINSRMISRMISSSSGESILLKWLPVAAV